MEKTKKRYSDNSTRARRSELNLKNLPFPHNFRLLDLGEKEFVGKTVFLVALEHRFLVKIIA